MDHCHDRAVSRIEWHKASYSSSNGGACVEVAVIGSAVAVRDSKDPDGRKLAFTPEDWKAFTARVKAGELGLP
jgi:Domain of unknown function (DUF397)